MKVLAIGVGVLGLLAAVIVVANPLYAKLLLGEARVLTERIPIALEIGERPMTWAACFRASSRFHGSASRTLVLWLEDPHTALGRHILIVDLDHKEVGVPNSSSRDYQLVLKRWLLQSEGGDGAVAFGGKLDAHDPGFQQLGNVVSFTIPPVLDLPPGRWNLTLNPKTGI